MTPRSTLLALALLGVMAWLAARSEHWRTAYSFRGAQADYYNLLAHGFAEGHLYLKAEVDPRLLSPDPEVRRQAPYLLDASLYRGRYYLYFGVVPAVLLFLPCHLLTGQDLPENGATLFLVGAGFLLYLRLYLEARRRYFFRISRPVHGACILLLAFGSGTPVLLTGSGFYEIAIAGGYACMAAAWLGLFRALQPDRRPRVWLALSSLALGLAVGCRPNYIFGLPLLAAAGVLLARRTSRGRLALAAAAVLPAAAVGLGLAVYNYQRFGNPLEFGFHYQLSALIAGGAPLARPSFFWPNLSWYYLRPPALSPYFPYVFPMNAAARPAGYYGYEAIHGQCPALLLALLCGWGVMARRRPPRTGGLSGFCVLVGGGFTGLFLGMAFFGFRADRYVPDFQGSLALLLALAGGGLAAGGWRGWRRAGGIFAALAIAGALTNGLASLQLLDHLQNAQPNAYRFLAYYGNYPSHLLARCGLLRYGPVRFKAVFHPVTRIATEPLLATGMPNATDVLYATQYPGGRVELALNHEGHGGLRAAPITVQSGREYEFEVDLGSFYPPRIHPYFRGWSAEDVERLKTTARVELDGREVIRGRLASYDSPPGGIHLGKNPAGIDPPFSGEVRARRRLPSRDPRTIGVFREPGVWRLRIELPSRPADGFGYPVLGSGLAGHGNLLMLQVLPGGRIRFGLDQWGAGLDSSPPVAVAPAASHLLEIFVGAQVVRQKMPVEWGVDPARLQASAPFLRVWLDGAPAWTVPLAANQDSYDWVSIGGNPQGFSTAGMFFMGTIESAPYAAAEMKDFVAKNLRATDGR